MPNYLTPYTVRVAYGAALAGFVIIARFMNRGDAEAFANVVRTDPRRPSGRGQQAST